MLHGISPLLSPDLLAVLCRMGHGDQILLADAHFPGHSQGPTPIVLRSDGVTIPALLEGILPLFVPDTYTVNSVVMMAAGEGDRADPAVEAEYGALIQKHWPQTPPVQKLERHAFYAHTKSVYAIVVTGDARKYANLILTKGVTPVG